MKQAKSSAIAPEYYCYVLMDGRKPGEFVYTTPSGTIVLAFEPFYVGKGIRDRSSKHTAPSLLAKHSPKNNKIRSIQRSGATVEIHHTTKRYTEQDAHRIERELIEVIGRRDQKRGPLTNLTDGGEGVSGLKRPEGYVAPVTRPEVRAKISNAKRGRARPDVAAQLAEFNHLQTPENRAKHLEGIRRAMLDPERRAKCATRTGSKASEETRRKMSETRMGMIVDNGRHILIGEKRYASLSAAARELGISVPGVRRRVLSDNFPDYRYAGE